MQCRHVRVGTLLGALVTAGIAGCGDGPETRAIDRSTAAAKVSGTIKVHGAPMRGGEVTFIPSLAARTVQSANTAQVQKDGTYTVTTLVGHNDVRISGPAVKKEPTLGYATKGIDVDPAGNTVDLEFP